jgi:dipeptidyl aminopeptidase/acylaminoacyl peptidase
LALATLPLAADGLKKWAVDDLVRVRRLESPVISPSGDFVAYLMSGHDVARNRRYADLFVVSAKGGAARQVTFDGEVKSAVQWSPDSKLVTFLAPDHSGKRQLWAAPPERGRARQLTAATLGVRAYAWAAKGARIAFTAAEPDSPEQAAWKREWGIVISPEETWPERGSVWVYDAATRKTSIAGEAGEMPEAVEWSPDGETVAFLRGRRVWLATGTRVEPVELEGVNSLAWSPGGDRIALVAVRDYPEPYVNLFRRPVRQGWGTIWLADGKGRSLRRLTTEEYPELGNAVWSRDGKRLAFIAKPAGSKDDRRAHPAMFIVGAGDGVVKQAAPGMDLYRGGTSMTWPADSGEVWFTHGERMGANVFAVDAATGRVRNVTEGQDTISEVTWSEGFRHAAFLLENANLKPDIHITGLPEWKPRKLTDANPEVRGFAWGPGEIIRYPSEGREIEALLVKPPDFERSRKYPLILIVHGGPAWVKKNDWKLEWEQHPIQAYASEGYCLVFPNVRGSRDYGAEFRQANYGDLGGGDARDALAAVDHLVGQGFIDEGKLGVAGWSYGGYMVPAILTQTDRFKAAQFGAGIPSFEAMYGRLSTVEWIVHENTGTRPWEDPQANIKGSPLYAARKVRTPTLIEHGEEDPRCPVDGSILFYKALKFYGVPAVLEIYPAEGHGITGPLLRRRCLKRNLEWFNKWLKGDRTKSFEKLFP